MWGDARKQAPSVQTGGAEGLQTCPYIEQKSTSDPLGI